MTWKFLYTLAVLILPVACQQKQQANPETESKTTSVTVPAFSSDSAYAYTAAQVGFGPRVPNTEAHVQCGHYLAGKLRTFGAEVTEQKTALKNYAGTTLNAVNIIGSFKPEIKNRVLLFAHWDTRPFADQDPDPANHRKPIDGANDGAGACAILLEIARQIGLQSPQVGVDIIFFDAEDWGAPDFERNFSKDSGYCLGSKYWSMNPHVLKYTAQYGILLDMTSAPGATFYKESYSESTASGVLKKIWKTAQTLGYGNYFVNADGGAIEDDHVYVIKNRKIPCVNIIQYDPSTPHKFGDYWHTLKDDMNHISMETMLAVGQTVLHVVYNEQ